MNEALVLDLTKHGMTIAVMVSMPILAVSLFIGLAVSIFQAMTQIQEMTLTYVPKLIGAGVVIALFGTWMLTTLVGFMTMCFEQAARVGV